MISNFYSDEELMELGFQSIGKNVSISKKCSIYNASQMSIGSNVRIDDFCILSGNITIGNYVHISAYTALYGKYGIKIGNYCGISPRSIIFSATDDFSGEYMISPLVPEQYTNILSGLVEMEDYVQIGSNSIVFPNMVIGEGSATGAFTLVNKELGPWGIYVGIPARKIKDRSKKVKEMSQSMDLKE